MTKYNYYIGIDTGVNTGICIYNHNSKLIEQLQTVKIHIALAMVKKITDNSCTTVFVRVEDARLRKWIPQQKNEKAERGRAAGAGSVKRDAQIWEDFLTDNNTPFELVAPKKNKTKIDSGYFQKITGYKGLTSNHARDAAMLVYGM